MLDGPPWLRPGPPPYPVPVLGTFGERCATGFRRVGPDRTGQLGCEIDWTCAAGTNGRSPAEGAQISLTGDHVVIDSDGYIRDVDNGVPCAMDAWARKVCGGEIREPLWEDRPEKWWAQFDACDPVACPAETPAPTARPTPIGGVRGFTLAFTNASNVCRGYKDHGDGVCSCEPDGAHRFKGTLIPQEKFVQNTVDRDHWHCAVEPCVKPDDKTDAEWAEVLQAHRDTYQLGGGDEWIVAQGIRHEWRYAGTDTWNVASRQGNPYQAEFRATCGAKVEARGCMDVGAWSCPDAVRNDPENLRTWGEFSCAPEHRRPVPGAGACGERKTYEVKR